MVHNFFMLVELFVCVCYGQRTTFGRLFLDCRLDGRFLSYLFSPLAPQLCVLRLWLPPGDGPAGSQPGCGYGHVPDPCCFHSRSLFPGYVHHTRRQLLSWQTQVQTQGLGHSGPGRCGEVPVARCNKCLPLPPGSPELR